MRPLIVFDMDGVLTMERSSWRVVHDHFGQNNEDSYIAYMNGEIDDGEFMRRDINIWKRMKDDISRDDIGHILSRVQKMDDMEASIKRLREAGAFLCVISGGLDQLLDLIGREMFHGTFANDLESDGDGLLTGEGVLRVPLTGKGSVLAAVIEEHGPFDRTIAVGDSAVDIPLFKACQHSVAFRPMDAAARDEADVVISGTSLEPVADHILKLLHSCAEK